MATPRRSLVALTLFCLIIFSCLEDVTSAGAGRRSQRGRGKGRGRGQVALPATVNFVVVEPDEKIFNIVDFRKAAASAMDDYEAGPGEDDSTPDWKMIILAFKAACQHPGKARLVFPKGQYRTNTLHFMGPCRATRLVFQLFGDLIGPTDMSMLPNPFWINFARLNNVVLLGSGGTIDGQGQGVWKNCLPNGCSALPPCNVKFDYNNNMVIKGIRSINPKAFHFHVHSCNNMRFENLFLGAPDWSPNTDGIHTSNTTFVRISHSTIATGDDCISLGHGSVEFDISDITCGPGHGISIGSLGKDGRPNRREKSVRGIRVKRILFRGTDNGIRIKTYPKPIPNQVHDVYFEDIAMENVKNPIIFDQEYSTKNARTSSHVKISDIHVRNIRGTSARPIAVNVKCSKTFPCEGLDFFNIDLRYIGTKPAQITSSCINARPSYGGIQRPAPCRPLYT
uniref:Polygalacturonase n=1 Tax=Kalanchoe fedtschenkoi TaxID=63787 RepID=A0A7N0TK01_KALFE